MQRELFLPVMLLVTFAHAHTALAGAVGGSPFSSASSSDINCDNRKQFIQCSETERSVILDKCYVAIHQTNRLDCSWQSCGYMSIIGQKPSVTLRNSVIEYGIETSGKIEKSWNCENGVNAANCMPKFPFPRHYLTVRQALELRNSNDTSVPAQRLRAIPQAVLESNPYLACASFAIAENSNKAVWVSIGKGSEGNWEYGSMIQWRVEANQVEEACKLLKKIGGKGVSSECYVNSTILVGPGSNADPASVYLKNLKK